MYTYRHTPGWMEVHMTSHNHLKRKWRAEQCVLVHIFFAIDTSGHGVPSKLLNKSSYFWLTAGYPPHIRNCIRTEGNSNVVLTFRPKYTRPTCHIQPTMRIVAHQWQPNWRIVPWARITDEPAPLFPTIVIVIYNFSHQFLRISKNN